MSKSSSSSSVLSCFRCSAAGFGACIVMLEPVNEDARALGSGPNTPGTMMAQLAGSLQQECLDNRSLNAKTSRPLRKAQVLGWETRNVSKQWLAPVSLLTRSGDNRQHAATTEELLGGREQLSPNYGPGQNSPQDLAALRATRMLGQLGRTAIFSNSPYVENVFETLVQHNSVPNITAEPRRTGGRVPRMGSKAAAVRRAKRVISQVTPFRPEVPFGDAVRVAAQYHDRTAVPALLEAYILSKPKLSGAQLEHFSQVLAQQSAATQLQAVAILVQEGYYFSAVKVVYADRELLKATLDEMRLIVSQHMDEDQWQAALKAWNWKESDKELFVTQFSELRIISYYKEVRRQLQALRTQGVAALVRVEREMLIKVIDDFHAQVEDGTAPGVTQEPSSASVPLTAEASTASSVKARRTAEAEARAEAEKQRQAVQRAKIKEEQERREAAGADARARAKADLQAKRAERSASMAAAVAAAAVPQQPQPAAEPSAGKGRHAMQGQQPQAAAAAAKAGGAAPVAAAAHAAHAAAAAAAAVPGQLQGIIEGIEEEASHSSVAPPAAAAVQPAEAAVAATHHQPARSAPSPEPIAAEISLMSQHSTHSTTTYPAEAAAVPQAGDQPQEPATQEPGAAVVGDDAPQVPGSPTAGSARGPPSPTGSMAKAPEQAEAQAATTEDAAAAAAVDTAAVTAAEPAEQQPAEAAAAGTAADGSSEQQPGEQVAPEPADQEASPSPLPTLEVGEPSLDHAPLASPTQSQSPKAMSPKAGSRVGSRQGSVAGSVTKSVAGSVTKPDAAAATAAAPPSPGGKASSRQGSQRGTPVGSLPGTPTSRARSSFSNAQGTSMAAGAATTDRASSRAGIDEGLAELRRAGSLARQQQEEAVKEARQQGPGSLTPSRMSTPRKSLQELATSLEQAQQGARAAEGEDKIQVNAMFNEVGTEGDFEAQKARLAAEMAEEQRMALQVAEKAASVTALEAARQQLTSARSSQLSTPRPLTPQEKEIAAVMDAQLAGVEAKLKAEKEALAVLEAQKRKHEEEKRGLNEQLARTMQLFQEQLAHTVKMAAMLQAQRIMTGAPAADAPVLPVMPLPQEVDEPPTEEEIRDYGIYLGMDVVGDSDLLYIAEWALTAPVPEGWTVHLDQEGHEFFFNAANNKSSYEHPMDEHYKEYYIKKKQEKHQKPSAPSAKPKALRV